MFIGTEIRLNVSFSAARARLADLARGGLLRRASDDAYADLGAGLARVGPSDAVPGLSRLVAVRFSDMTIHQSFASVAMRWEATGPGGALFPTLDADITLSPAGDDATAITIAGVYRPPLGLLGASLDRVILHRVAEATIRVFAQDIAAAIADHVGSGSGSDGAGSVGSGRPGRSARPARPGPCLRPESGPS